MGKLIITHLLGGSLLNLIFRPFVLFFVCWCFSSKNDHFWALCDALWGYKLGVNCVTIRARKVWKGTYGPFFGVNERFKTPPWPSSWTSLQSKITSEGQKIDFFWGFGNSLKTIEKSIWVSQKGSKTYGKHPMMCYSDLWGPPLTPNRPLKTKKDHILPAIFEVIFHVFSALVSLF